MILSRLDYEECSKSNGKIKELYTLQAEPSGSGSALDTNIHKSYATCILNTELGRARRYCPNRAN